MKEIVFLDRMTKEIVQEKVYGQTYLEPLYENRFLRRFFLPWLSHHALPSKLYGALQKSVF